MANERRQAVVIIHGIGDQVPMATLRGFAEAVWPTDGKQRRMWSRPDGVSENFDLRQIVAIDDGAKVRTDFFEFYWAHLMEGTKLASVWSWIVCDFLLRSDKDMPKPMRSARVLVSGFLAAVVLALAGLLFLGGEWWPLVVIEWIVVGVFVLINLAFLTPVIGDAARYFRARPENIAARQAVRKLGVDIIDRLHEDQRGYERIILVGHSLGSVIGYDILTYAFARRSRDIEAGSNTRPETIAAFEIAANEVELSVAKTPADRSEALKRFQSAQRALSLGLGAAKGWRVSDFVTAGSPLTYSRVLMARDANDFAERIRLRELPVCPPPAETTSGNAAGMRAFYLAGRAIKTQHAAVFAFTRWTNLYFPVRRLIYGDPIGGAVGGNFGSGIRDVAVHTIHRGGRGLFNHDCYWRIGGEKGEPNHVAALRSALDLGDTGLAASLPEDTKKH